MKKINVIITGATGMIGESVLDQCLKHEQIGQVLIINRRPSGFQHPKLKELVLPDLAEVTTIKEELKAYDACFFCIGISSIGMDEEKYTRLTYTLTMNFARVLAEANPAMTFCYISGAGTDSTEKGRTMWARVKGKTENDLMKLGFKHVYNFRPAALIPYLEIKPNQTYQSVKYLKWLLILLRPLFPNNILKLSDFAIAMINSSLVGYPKQILEAKDIKALALYRTE
ncbi:NAD-dependent epimerase/dehydratase family protein [Parabacteroides sp. FAFU027]|uniref:NAD-dependent epimerase/dehydratase family protein n=1 Tax=Parabacteroides sp. FAFU027 TaxID=2922715 RepID=UPI001FAF5C5D|nr:NAD-dependent epimerase/dehydratase family protein [Parabacteroides sp. FAFU027]